MICGDCRAEVRFGWRDGQPGWWHREDVGHPGIPVCPPEVEQIDPLPPVEVWCHPVEPDTFAPRSGIRQVVNLVDKTEGWERYRLTHARGPYTGAKGELLSISDTIVLGARNVLLDGTVRVAVASWRDGKFDFAFVGLIQGGRLTPYKVDATTMKNWIKGTHDLPADPLQQP